MSAMTTDIIVEEELEREKLSRYRKRRAQKKARRKARRAQVVESYHWHPRFRAILLLGLAAIALASVLA